MSDKHQDGTVFDLVFSRVIDVPRAIVWRAWTEPEQLVKWFTPVPWRTTHCEIDLRPGGIFRTVMEGPQVEGVESCPHDSSGCYLEVIAPERLVWTSLLGPGFRPNDDVFLPFTGVLTLADEGGRTRYTARVMHRNDADRQKHADMGFQDGWGKALDQLVAAAHTMV